MESSLRLGRIGGIEIGINYSWLIIFALVTWSLAVGVFPQTTPGLPLVTYWVMGAVAALLLFAAVLAHELAHSFVAIARGMPVKSITLFVFGGVSNVQKEPDEPADEFWMAIVGPLTSVAVGLLFGAVAFLLRDVLSPPVFAIVSYLAVINVILAIFNLIPGFPLDGGRVFRAIVWWITGSLKQATEIAAGAGRIIAYLFIFGGLYMAFGGNLIGGIWLIFIGWFLATAADVSARQVSALEALRGIAVRDVMNSAPVTVPRDVTIHDLVHDYILTRNVRAFPVVEDGNLVGMVTLSDVRLVPREQWEVVAVEQIMRPANALTIWPRRCA